MMYGYEARALVASKGAATVVQFHILECDNVNFDFIGCVISCKY